MSEAGWRSRAACRDVDQATRAAFYPEVRSGRKGPTTDEWETARAVCRACPVSADCLAHALATKEPHGMWGGLTPLERSGRRWNRRVSPWVLYDERMVAS